MQILTRMNTRQSSPKIMKRSRTKLSNLHVDDVIMEILKRLDAKTLLRLRCVCCDWDHMIRQSYFADLNHNFLKSLLHGAATFLIYSFVYTKSYYEPSDRSRSKLYFYKLDDNGKAEQYFSINASDIGFKRIGCVSDVINGLVCISNYNRVVVCNITTREIVRLPKTRRKSYMIDKAVRAYYVPHYSFGFDPSTKEYKVLRTWVNVLENFVRCELYILRSSKRWRKINDFPTNLNAIGTKSMCIDGCLYWLDEKQVLVFDFLKEKFRAIDIPKSVSRSINVNSLGEALTRVGASIAVKVSECIYILDAQKGSWTRKEFDNIGETMLVGSSETTLFFLHSSRTIDNITNPSSLNLLCVDHDGTLQSSFDIHGSFPASFSTLFRLPISAVTEHVENIYPLSRI